MDTFLIIIGIIGILFIIGVALALIYATYKGAKEIPSVFSLIFTAIGMLFILNRELIAILLGLNNIFFLLQYVPIFISIIFFIISCILLKLLYSEINGHYYFYIIITFNIIVIITTILITNFIYNSTMKVEYGLTIYFIYAVMWFIIGIYDFSISEEKWLGAIGFSLIWPFTLLTFVGSLINKNLSDD